MVFVGYPRITVLVAYVWGIEGFTSVRTSKHFPSEDVDICLGFYDDMSNEIVISAAGILRYSDVEIIDGRLYTFFTDAFTKTVTHEVLHYLMADEETTEEEEEWALERLGLA